MNEQYEGFQDPTELTRWTRGFLYASLALPLFSILVEVSDLRGSDLWGYGSEGPTMGFAASVFLMGLARIGLTLITAILVLTWVQRANHNARSLGAVDMQYTPGWAVGWYFVPIAWFWKPYQAMKEIWRASANPANWPGEPGSPLLHWWWILWIAPFWGISLVEWTVGRTLDEAGAETLEAATGLVSNILNIPLIFVLLAIIGRVHSMQMKHARRQAAAT